MILLLASLFAVIPLLAPMFAGTEPANAFDFIKGVDYSPHMPGENCTEFGKANYTQDFEWMKQANINTIRTYDWIPEEILANATEYEIKVIEGIWIPTDGNFSDETFKNECKNHIAEVINRDKDKSCIIGWCIGNELNESAVEKVGKEETEKFLKELYIYAQSLDSNPNHFVTHANWPPLDYLDLSFFDVISFNVYSYWPPKVVSRGYYGYLCDLKRKYPNKPILITEFGYSTSPNGSGNCGYGGNSEEEQADCIKQRWNDIVRAGCLGGIVFEWNDEWWKNNCTGDDKNSHDPNDPEEWFGVIAVNGTDQDNYTLKKKQAYYAVKEMFSEEYPTKADLTSPVIDDFEDADVSDWFAFATPNASINISSSNNTKVGNYSMKIDYNTGGKWCGAYKEINTWVNYDNVSLWMCGDNSGNTLEIKFEENYGGEQWIYKSYLNWSGWRQFNIPISFLMDKAKINRFTLAISGTNTSNSTIYVDDITLKLSNISDEDFLDMVEHATFEYFWNEANQNNGLIKERSTSDSPCSVAAVGFGLSAICIAERRGWITYEEAYSRTLTTLKTFNNSINNTHGFYYHWINMSTGEREWNCEVSSIDTALLMAGVLHAGEHFKGTEIENLSIELYQRVNWTWMLDNDTGTLFMAWKPEIGFLPYHWEGYNEAMILYLLAIGSPTYPIPNSSWDAWAKTYKRGCGNGEDFIYCPTGSLFTYQYSHCWVDFRNKHDAYADYWQNSINAVKENRLFCINNSNVYATYGENCWGLTACDGPCGYTGYGSCPNYYHDGTIAPTGAGGSVALAPDIAIPALWYMYETYGGKIWGKYGFKDAFNLDTNVYLNGCQPWWDEDYIGIDEGAIILMIENYRSGLVWNDFMQSEYTKKAMDDVGFVTPTFDTGPGAYPSIMGNHAGTIKPNHTVIATKLYTYPCEGTGGHTEYAEIRNLTWNATATWEGYIGDWHNITFDKTVVLLANETYNYTIKTGSYPQIHHNTSLLTANGWINCTQFVDANGKRYNDWIPTIRLWS